LSLKQTSPPPTYWFTVMVRASSSVHSPRLSRPWRVAEIGCVRRRTIMASGSTCHRRLIQVRQMFCFSFGNAGGSDHMAVTSLPERWASARPSDPP